MSWTFKRPPHSERCGKFCGYDTKSGALFDHHGSKSEAKGHQNSQHRKNLSEINQKTKGFNFYLKRTRTRRISAITVVGGKK